jgi:hypothetical protein
MAWREIYEQDLVTQISGAELDAIRQAVLAEGQADPVLPTIQQVTGEVRGYVAGCAANTLGAEGTVPEELIGHAVAIVVMRIMGRPAAAIIDSKSGARADAAATALSVLRDVAACKFKIAQPETPTTESVASTGPRFSTTRRTRNFDGCSQDGV